MLFGDARSPYCWYGTEPTLFDAPSRFDRSPLGWLAYSFLATTPIEEVDGGSTSSRRAARRGSGGDSTFDDDGSAESAPASPRLDAGMTGPTVVPMLRVGVPGPALDVR